jgi:hypothetical protein
MARILFFICDFNSDWGCDTSRIKKHTLCIYKAFWISSILEEKHSSFHLKREKLVGVKVRDLFEVKNQHLSC